ncbi:MAG: class II D-tagatose-bisphosphate aldolase, non-catalytic subunit [Rhodobacteraceae bacterium]|nr:class II D-tagatose-bisphosphate aldolase, non-catalytic subunit [Paracoccaceae bacterium]
MADLLRDTIAHNRAGARAALPSVCSAHPVVLEAVLRQAEALDRPLLIEATSNQVNQDGGYTGLRPTDFVSTVTALAERVGCDGTRIVFGGDHLGPQAWKAAPAAVAMARAEVMLREYVEAGFTKIHLDCSEGCAGEAAQLDDATVAQRAARLADVCETAASNPDALSYIIGTEVPPPGGARDAHVVVPTRPEAARITLAAHFGEFSDAAAARIVGLVVQPGVEFGALTIDHLPCGDGNMAFRDVLSDRPGLCLEAHSTDYQRPDAYPRLAEMGFAVLKVGPALTFAYREAVYALDMVLDLAQGVARRAPSPRQALEAAMQDNPVYWSGHYHGTYEELEVQRHFAWSDRIRYYWPAPPVQAAVAGLKAAVDDAQLPTPLLHQVFSADVLARADTIDVPSVFDRLTQASVQAALAPYFLEEVTQ